VVCRLVLAIAVTITGLTFAGVLTLRCRCINCWILVKLSDRGGGPGGGGGIAPRVRLSLLEADPWTALLVDALLLAAGGGPGGGGGIDLDCNGGAEGWRLALGGVAVPDDPSGNEVCCSALGAYDDVDGGE